MSPEHQRLLAIVKQPDGAVRAAFRVGSRVYGTAGPRSDHDYVVVLASPAQRQDLLFAEGVNVTLHGVRSFEAALNDGSVFAFEALFAPPPHRIKEPVPPFSYRLDRKKLCDSAVARSTSDYEKARKRFAEELGPSKKKLFHALRVPLFALELARTGKIESFGAAGDHFEDIMSHPSEDFADYEAAFGPVRTRLCEELSALAGR
jgi:Nucleotidyltransferase domain